MLPAGLMSSGSEATGRGYKVREGRGEESCWMSVRRFRVNWERLLEPSSFIAVSRHWTQDLFIASRRLSHSGFCRLFDSLSCGVSPIHLLDSGGASQAFGCLRGCGESCGEVASKGFDQNLEGPCILLVRLDAFLTRLQQPNVYLSICGMIFCGIPTVSFISWFSNIIFASMWCKLDLIWTSDHFPLFMQAICLDFWYVKPIC